MAKQRIDVHTHVIPPFWAEELKSDLTQMYGPPLIFKCNGWDNRLVYANVFGL